MNAVMSTINSSTVAELKRHKARCQVIYVALCNISQEAGVE